MKNGQKVFVIHQERIGNLFPQRKTVRECTLHRYHANISEVDFGGAVGIMHVYTEDIFATKREALEEILVRLEENKSLIKKQIEALDD